MKIVIQRRLFWYYKLVAANGQTLATSETYYSHGNVKRAAQILSSAINVPIE